MVERRSSDEATLRTVVDLIDRAAATDDPGPVLPWSVIDDLARLIPAEELTIADLSLVDESRVIQQGVIGLTERCIDGPEADDPAEREVFWRYFKSFWAGGLPSRAGEVRRWSDRYSGPEGRREPLLAEFFHPRGMTHALTLGFPTAAGHELNLLFFRFGGQDFTDRDKDLLRLLRPHVAEILAAGNRRRMGRLTPREWQVLELAAAGHSNADIAAVLCASVATVRKHMEHIFDRAGVRTRTAAVAHFLPALSPTRSGPGPRIGT